MDNTSSSSTTIADMPNYEYRCPKCETLFEINKPMADSDREERCEVPLTDLYTEPKEGICDGILKRVFMNQGGTFVLKGRGWTGKINPK